MKYRTSIPRRNAKTFIASLLTYVMLTSQLAPLALGFDRSLNALSEKSSASDGSRTQSSEAPSVKQENASAAVPVPLRVAPLAVAPIITATKVDSFADSDGDSKAEPGETITYSITITNTGDQPALNLTLNDTVDPNTTIVGGSLRSTPIAVNDAYSVLGNVRINVPDGGSDLLANDTDPENAGNSNTGLTITTLAGDNSAPFAGTSANGGQVTATTGDGSFTYNPAPGFTGTDTFSYTTTDGTGGGTSTATVTLTVANLIWFVNATAGPGGDGRFTSPFNCLVGAGCFDPVAADDPGDIIFLYSGSYTGGLALLNNQKMFGAGASQPLDVIAGITVPPFSETLPPTGQAFPAVTTTAPATNAINIGTGNSNTLRGFNIGNTTGAKISSPLSPPAAAFGTLTISEMTLSGSGQALNLDNGTLAATFTSITSTSSTGAGIVLDQIAGSLTSTGGTTISGSTAQCLLVSGSTADMSFGNTSCSGGTIGVSLQSNTAGTRTFGTLAISNNSGAGFLSNAGGNANITGATTIPAAAQTAPVGTAIDIQNLAVTSAVAFALTAINKGNAGIGVNLGTNAGNVTFNSLGITASNGSGLVGTNNTGQINVTTNAGSIAATNGPAINITKAADPATPITLNFTALTSTNSPSQGINIDRVSGNLSTGSTTFSNPALTVTGTGIQVQRTVAGGTMNFGTTSVTGSGNANVDAGGTGVFLNANAGNITFGDLDIAPDSLERAFQSTASTGTISTSSGDIAATGNVTLDIVGPAGRTPLAMTLNNLDSTNSNGVGVNLNFVSGNLTVNDATATNISNPAGVGIQVQNTAAGTMSFGNTLVSGSGGISVSLGTAGNGNAGTITFADLDMTPDSGQRAFVALDNTGTLNVTSGDITTLGAATAAAVFIDGPAARTPINLTFNAVTTTNVGVGTVTPTTSSIHLVDVSGTKFQVTGTTQINTRAGTGVFVNNSTATNIQLGTTNIPNPSNAGGYGIRVESSSSAVTVASATIDNATVTTAQTDSGNGFSPGNDGDGDAIFLKSNTGSFSLSAGTLSNCGNDCIDARTTSGGVTISGIAITSPGTDTPGTGLAVGGNSIQAINMTGTNSITGTTMTNSAAGHAGIYFFNNGGNTSTTTVQGVIFQTFTANGSVGMQVITQGSSTTNMTIGGPTNNAATNCTFTNVNGSAVNFATSGTATLNATLQRSTFQNAATNAKTNVTGGNTSGGKATYNILNNTFNTVMITASTGEGLLSFSADATVAGNTFAMNMTGNTISNIGNSTNNCGAGATACLGPLNAILIFIDNGSNVPGTIIVENNTVTNTQQGAMLLDMHNTGATAGTGVAAKIINNTFGTDAARVGVNNAPTTSYGLRVERRANNAPAANVLVSGNSIRNGSTTCGVGCATTLNGAGIHLRTKANDSMSVTVTNNNVSTVTSGHAEMRLESNANDVGDIVSPTLCVDATGNTLATGASGVITLFETNGALNIEQASSAALSTANNSATVTTSFGTPQFGVVCAVPPAFTDPGDSIANIPATSTSQPAAEPAAATQAATPSDSILNKPFVSSPQSEGKAVQTKVDAFAGVTSGVGVQKGVAEKAKPAEKPIPPTIINPVPPVIVGDNITWNVGTLPAGQSVTITFQVTIDNPYNGPANVSNQGTVTADGGISVLTDDPAVMGTNNPTLTPIDVPPLINIKDAKVAEPTSGTASMLFTVALSAVATGPVSVNFATANGGPTPATGGSPPCAGTFDYETTSGTVSFVAGQQIQTISVPVCSDATVESDETFLVNLSTPVNGNIADGQATGTITAANPPGTVLISELRTSGPGGLSDDFVELYNNSDSALTVTASDSSGGYGLYKSGAAAGDAPIRIATIANGTVIPARGHYLLVGSAYSLANYGGSGAAAGNLTLVADIENDRNVALFNTADVTNVSTTTRLDAVGFGSNTGGNFDLLREGTNLLAAGGSAAQYSFVRLMTTGLPQDLNNNLGDFVIVATDSSAPIGSNPLPILGAPGPENATSPIQRNATVKASLIDPAVSSNVSPNRIRDTTSYVDTLTPSAPNGGPPATNPYPLGTLLIRRKFTNNTGGAVTRLRFRVVEITTLNSPVVGAPPQADMRALTSPTQPSVTITGGGTVAVQGITLEQPPATLRGGGLNSTLSAGTISLGTPLANGANINVNFLLGVASGGSFRFFINVEALP